MIINNLNATNHSNRQQIMAQAQTIMNFFTDAVEQNDCNVKIVIGFYTEIQDTINSINDLEGAFNQPVYQPDYWKSFQDNDWTVDHTPDTPPLLTDTAVLEEAKKAIKNRCFNCRLSLPKVDVSFDRDFLFNKLSLQLEVYKVNFKSNLKFSLCQASFMFQRTCIPDLIRLLGLFLSAYAAMLALKKLPKISIGIFVRAIIGQLMAKVVASLKITVDMNSTGIPCIVTALKDIAHALPTNENIKNRLDEEQYAVLPQGYKPINAYAKELQADVKNGIRTQAEADKLLDEYKRKNDTINYYADKLKEETDRLQKQVDDGIRMITDVVDNAVEDVNSYIDSILGVINFLQCENKRTGSDFSEIIEYANKLQKVINLISAIIAYMAKQFFRSELCKDAQTAEQLKEAITNAPKPDLTTPDAIAEIAREWSGSTVRLDSEGLNLLIYDSPVKQTLPKLTLLGCNFREFAAAHTLDNIITTAASEVAREGRGTDIPSFTGTDPDIPSWTDPSNPITLDPSNTNIPRRPYTIGTSDPHVDDTLRPYRDPDTGTIINDKLITPGNMGGSNPDNRVYNGKGTSNGTNDTDKSVDKGRDTGKSKDKGRDRDNTPDPTIPGVDNTPEIIDSIPIDPEIRQPVFKDWTKSIDELVDFIYNPLGDTPKGNDPVKGSNPEINLPDEEISFFNTETSQQQRRYQPSLDECRSVEDVMNLLETLKP